MEAWVKPSSAAGGQVIMYNGSTATSGWGIIIGVSNYMGLFGGRVGLGRLRWFPTSGHMSRWCVTASPPRFEHQRRAGDDESCHTERSGGKFALGAPPQARTSQFFTGLIHEARVFTFAPGQFSTNDLLIDRSLVVTTLADGGAGPAQRPGRRFRRGYDHLRHERARSASRTGGLVLTSSINDAGPGRANLIISGNNLDRVVYVSAGVNDQFFGNDSHRRRCHAAI